MTILRVSSLVGQSSLILDGDSLVVLEGGYSRDRVTRIFYESVESIIVWSDPQWFAKIAVTIILGYICVAPFTFGGMVWDEEDKAGYAVLLALLGALELIVIIRKKYHLRVHHGGAQFNISVTAFPWTIRKFADKFRTQAEEAQRKLRAERDKAVTADSGKP